MDFIMLPRRRDLLLIKNKREHENKFLKEGLKAIEKGCRIRKMIRYIRRKER